MQYKNVYKFQWLLILWLIFLIYFSNLILIKLPFVGVNFSFKDSKDFFHILFNLIPKYDYSFEIYNLQTLIVWASGILVGSKRALIVLSIYVLSGIIGLPLFAGGGGLEYFNEPTFGYLLSFPVLAYLSGWFYEKGNKIYTILLPIFISHVIGILYLILFKSSYLDIAWYLSFSMIGYDLIFAFALFPLLSIFSFFINEMFMEELPDIGLKKV